MVTIRDIAKLAGVAQGTVSNVLNGKGNVSSEKIKRVMDAAKELGYVPNERAALLRKGKNNALAVLMPDSRARHYEDFYSGFKNYAQSRGFSVSQHLTGENASVREEEALAEIRPLMVRGIACISSAAGTARERDIYKEDKELDDILFVEHRPGFSCNFLGFDYQRAGEAMGKRVLEKGYLRVCLLTGKLCFSNEEDFYRGFMAASGGRCQVLHIQTDSFRKYQNIMQIFNGPKPQAFVISNYGFAESVKDICSAFYDTDKPMEIYTVSPVFTMPENDFIKYEMNYRQLGKVAAETLIRRAQSGGELQERLLENSGFRDWYCNIIPSKSGRPVNVITLDSPEAYIMRNFSRLYTKKSGTRVNICILSYDEIYEAFNNLDETSNFDVIRLDVTWLSWFAKRLLMPLTDIEPKVGDCFGEFLKGTPEHYAMAQGQIYALPSTPSAQILYYRKDLFESPIYKRMYFEQFKTELRVPETFEEFNRIAAFFTRSLNPSSPVDYGATLTMGSTGVAGSEYLARLFVYQDNLYDKNREIHLDSPAGLKALKEVLELRSCTPPGYCGWWVDTARSFAAGNYAMSILYSNYASDLLGHASRIVGNIGCAMMPGNNPVIGGGSLGVFKYSRQPKEALSFIRWMCSEPVSSAASLLGSTSPCRKTYENYEVVSNFPWMNLVKKCFHLTKGNRIPEDVRIPFDERRFLSILGMAVKNACSGISEPQEALSSAQEQFERYFRSRF